MNKLESFLSPKSVAIIGASSNPVKLGWQILANLKSAGFSGNIYPVNLHETEILGLKVYPAIDSLPTKIDLAIIVIPASFVLEEVKKAASLGIKNLVIISAGFGEAGKEGKAIEIEIKKIAKENDLNILGPNCLGFINYRSRLNVTFANTFGSEEGKKNHNIAFLSQSGAIGSSVLDWTKNKNIGFSLFVSLGNKAVLDENDFFEYLLTDDNSDLVVAYLEEISDGPRFLNLVSRLSKIKPVAILKAGRTETGSAAAMSHTGSMAGGSEAVKTALIRSGAIVLNDMSELFNLMRLIKKPLELTNSDLYIISNAGGPLVISTDEAFESRLALPKLSLEIKNKITPIMPSFSHVENPLDILGDATSERYEKALEALLPDPKIQTLLILLTPQSGTDIKNIAEVIGRFSLKYPDKLIITSFIGGVAIADGKKILAEYLVPNFDYPEEAIRVLKHYLGYQKNKKSLVVYKSKKVNSLDPVTNGLWDYLDTKKLLDEYGIKTVKTLKVGSISPKIKYPIVAKVVGPDVVHKSEAQAIFLNLKDEKELKKISKNTLLKDGANYLVAQEMVRDGLEIILGFKRDNNFGPIIIVGWGGIYTEVIKDVELFLAEDNTKLITEKVKQLKVFKLIQGARGKEAFDLEALVDNIKKLVILSLEHPEIKELDINPAFLLHHGFMAADWRIIS
ncbi:MAG: acetate--CoA ligase family protein [Candidatus Falkowbacteria bacterium]